LLKNNSHHVFPVRASREKRFGLRHAEWRFLLTWADAKEFPHWEPWDAVFGLLQPVNDLLEHPRLAAMTDSVQAIELDRAVAPAAVVLPASLWPTIPSGLVGEAALAANVERLRHLLNHLQPA
jgi:hypothetical protein